MTVTLAYENLSAALWASEKLTVLFGGAIEGTKPRLSPWNFATLEDPAACARATAAAIASDLIIIAISSESRLLPPSLETWLERSLAKRQSLNPTVAALFGRDDSADAASSPRFKALQRIAKDAGCEFFVPAITEPELSVA